MSLSEYAGREIRAELARQQKTITWLASQLGVDRPGLNRRLNGDRRFDLDLVENIAAALNVPVRQFLNGTIEAGVA